MDLRQKIRTLLSAFTILISVGLIRETCGAPVDIEVGDIFNKFNPLFSPLKGQSEMRPIPMFPRRNTPLFPSDVHVVREAKSRTAPMLSGSAQNQGQAAIGRRNRDDRDYDFAPPAIPVSGPAVQAEQDYESAEEQQAAAAAAAAAINVRGGNNGVVVAVPSQQPQAVVVGGKGRAGAQLSPEERASLAAGQQRPVDSGGRMRGQQAQAQQMSHQEQEERRRSQAMQAQQSQSQARQAARGSDEASMMALYGQSLQKLTDQKVEQKTEEAEEEEEQHFSTAKKSKKKSATNAISAMTREGQEAVQVAAAVAARQQEYQAEQQQQAQAQAQQLAESQSQSRAAQAAQQQAQQVDVEY